MNGQCVFKDDFEFIRKHIADADLVAFATPMYYFGISAQIKTVIDRFYAINGQIHVPKKAVLMMTYADNSKKKESAIISHYEVLLDYLGWTDAGEIIAPGRRSQSHKIPGTGVPPRQNRLIPVKEMIGGMICHSDSRKSF